MLNAGDGKEAIDIVMAIILMDIILMDIQLPVIDGYGAAKKIRECKGNYYYCSDCLWSAYRTGKNNCCRVQ